VIIKHYISLDATRIGKQLVSRELSEDCADDRQNKYLSPSVLKYTCNWEHRERTDLTSSYDTNGTYIKSPFLAQGESDVPLSM